MTYLGIIFYIHLNIIVLRKFKRFLIFFEKCIKNIFKIFLKKTTKKKWFKGAHVAPYSIFGLGYF